MKRLKSFLTLILKDLQPHNFDDFVDLILTASLVPLILGVVAGFFNSWLASLIIYMVASVDVFVFGVWLGVQVFKYLESKWGESKL